jgi:hypothetical protein
MDLLASPTDAAPTSKPTAAPHIATLAEQEWILTVADAATGGEDLALQESYPSFESAAAAVLVEHLVAFDHPVEITSLPPNRWLLKHLDQRDQPVDVIRIHLVRDVPGSRPVE